MNRMGLIDFWYYTNEEFHFSNGHMLLRGSNGSGKSVTMQSLIPLLLDGNKSSERLDPFGTRARKMETYLLDESGKHEDRIGYLYLEFKKGDTELYTTIGMGIRARKNRPLDTWYFVIEDNRRINKDLHLAESNKTLTKQELKHRITTQLIETQKQYMEKVNQVLFGFEHVLDYKEAIDLLLQLRAPKLSNSFKPTMLNEVLSQSLQPLSEDDLRDMSEAISNMDHLKSQLESLEASTSAANDIMAVYQKYNEAMLYDKLNKYQRENSDFKRLQSTIKKNKTESNQLMKKNEQLLGTEQTLKQEQTVLIEEKNMLGHSDIATLQHDITVLETQITETKNRLENKQKASDQKENFLIDKRSEEKKHEDNLTNLKRRLDQIMEQLDGINDEWPFREHQGLKNDIYDQLGKGYNYTHVGKQLENELQILTRAKEKFAQQQFYENQLKGKENEKEITQDQLATKQTDLAQAEQFYQDIIEEYKEVIAKWIDANALIKVDEASFKNIINHLLKYEDTKDYQPILTIITNIKDEIKDRLRTQRIKLTNEKEQINTEITNIEMELSKWQQHAHQKPPISKESETNRAYLRELMIPHVPLHEIIEFDETMPQEQINQIEEALTRSGLLDAILVEEKYRPILLKQDEQKTDNYLFVKSVMNELKEIILTKTYGLTQAFKMLGINHSDQMLLTQDNFHLGVLEGNLSGAYPAKFIGSLVRENHRQHMIEKLEKELADAKQKLTEATRQILSYDEKLQTVEEEAKQFPTAKNLESALSLVTNLHDDIKALELVYEQILAAMNEIKQEMAPIREMLTEAATHLGIDTKEENFTELEDLIREYRQDLTQFIQTHGDYVRTFIMKENATEFVARLIEETDEIRFEIDDLSQHLSKDESVLLLKCERLEELGFSDVRKRLEEIDKRLKSIPDEIGQIKQELGSNTAILTNLKQQLDADGTSLEQQEILAGQYLDILKQEVALGLVVVDKTFDMDVLLKMQNESSNHEMKDKIYGDLHAKFHARMGALQEYNISMTYALKNPYDEIEDVSERVVIVGKIGGKKVDFSELMKRLAYDKDLAQQILKAEDRKLFEEILISTVSKKIRARIRNSDAWVKKMNSHMSEMNTSSGLKLQLLWKAHSAASEDQLDTKELVGLLMRDEHMLTEADKKKVSKHFRSKIDLARDTDLNEQITASFHQIMREVMDYRKWFTFTINYQKSGEVKKELTNNRFSTFSGGEKAMAMYIPLFSAVAAKFDNAKVDSPVIIALDEAFAGVDENNIDSMFELIGKFGFDYIMNSQVLWGDYPSVKDLSIYELHRPDNATFVTMMRYHWNGHVKTYMS